MQIPPKKIMHIPPPEKNNYANSASKKIMQIPPPKKIMQIPQRVFPQIEFIFKSNIEVNKKVNKENPPPVFG